MSIKPVAAADRKHSPSVSSSEGGEAEVGVGGGVGWPWTSLSSEDQLGDASAARRLMKRFVNDFGDP